MDAISQWLSPLGFRSLEPGLVIATPVAGCNLKCLHCYWSSEMRNRSADEWSEPIHTIKNLGNISLVYAGRLLNRAGIRLIKQYVEATNRRLSIIDNGWTILSWKELLPLYDQISISVDGWKGDHDKQRGKEGAFDRAWRTVLELKELGLDPIVSTALSPLTFNNWVRLEEACVDNDVRISATIVWDLPETHSSTVFDESGIRKAFQALVEGYPKLINLYADEHIRSLSEILRSLSWVRGEDRWTSTLPNGTVVVYRPPSVVAVTEVDLLWDGGIYTSLASGIKIPIEEVGTAYFSRLNKMREGELETWRLITERR